MEAQGSRSLLISALITWPWQDQGGGVHAEWQTQETEAEAEREEESRNDVDLHQTCVSASCSPSNIQNNHVNITSHHSSLTKSLPLGGWANDWSCVPPTRVKIRSTRPTNIRLYIYIIQCHNHTTEQNNQDISVPMNYWLKYQEYYFRASDITVLVSIVVWMSCILLMN